MSAAGAPRCATAGRVESCARACGESKCVISMCAKREREMVSVRQTRCAFFIDFFRWAVGGFGNGCGSILRSSRGVEGWRRVGNGSKVGEVMA